MSAAGHIAVIDIGKTNAKIALVDRATLTEVAVTTQPNTVSPGPPWPHFNLEGLWAFILDGLAAFSREADISAIVTTTHGASAVLLDAEGNLAAPMLDYEFDIPATHAAAYDAIRPPFAQTGSPRLPMGLNVGAQLHFMLAADPSVRERLATIVTYPQYWGYRLSGVRASDLTSLGCHTDLWNPHERRLSSLPARLGLSGLIAPPQPCGAVLGPVRPGIAARTGLVAGTPVYCGIHDSNASLLPHLATRTPPFSVVSTGTWVIAMTVGATPHDLDPAKDTLINVNAFGERLPSARFMGGREFALATDGRAADPAPADRAAILAGSAMLLPSLVSGSGPFSARTAAWIGGEPELGSGERTVAVSFYIALMTAQCLALIGHRGPVIVEGPFARNPAFLDMLGVASASRVVASPSATGTSVGAAWLVAVAETRLPASADTPIATPDDVDALRDYASCWQDRTAR